MSARLTCRVRLETVSEGYYRAVELCQPRVGVIPPSTAILTMMRVRILRSTHDKFIAYLEKRSDDLGRTWSHPIAHVSLDRRRCSNGVEISPWDMTPAWHAATGKLLMTGATRHDYPFGHDEGAADEERRTRRPSYAVYDEENRRWFEWAIMEMPDRFLGASAGCTQRVDLANGEILLPLCCSQESAGASDSSSDAFVAVTRCGFDGTTLCYLDQGTKLRMSGGRGLAEPSLTHYRGKYYLTLRNDFRGYVATSPDGMHYEEPVPWTFDDGEELGSYNTQQHWVTHSDGLFLSYTRQGANNDEVILHRAPLFMAEVDPKRCCVIRETERELVPNRGAPLGNFGTVNVSPSESWVLTAESMAGDAEDQYDLARTEQRGANNRVYVCRIVWDRPNDLDQLMPA